MGKMFLLIELWNFMRIRKKWWLLPMFMVIFFFALLLVFVQTSPLMPFIYTLI